MLTVYGIIRVLKLGANRIFSWLYPMDSKLPVVGGYNGFNFMFFFLYLSLAITLAVFSSTLNAVALVAMGGAVSAVVKHSTSKRHMRCHCRLPFIPNWLRALSHEPKNVCICWGGKIINREAFFCFADILSACACKICLLETALSVYFVFCCKLAECENGCECSLSLFVLCA